MSIFEPLLLLVIVAPFGIACFLAGYGVCLWNVERMLANTDSDHEHLRETPL